MIKRPGTFAIGPHEVGGGRSFLIAEIAQAHDGSLGLAHRFIDAAAEAGADAIKFQTHIAEAESTLDEPFRIRFSWQDDTRYAYWKRMEFTAAQWAGLAQHAAEKSLVFLSSAFSVEAVTLLGQLAMPAWKIASGELGSGTIVDAMISTGAPFLVSSGMSSWREIDAIVERLRAANRQLAVMQCTTKYPTPLEEVGLNVIDEMRIRYGAPAGLSDHSGVVFPAICAIARGADLIEAHLTLDRRMFGPDVPASLTVDEFRLVSGFRDAAQRMDKHPIDKDAMAELLSGMRATFRRSVATNRALPRGTVLAADDLALKKPGTGIPAEALRSLVGRRLARPVSDDRLLSWDDIEGGHG